MKTETRLAVDLAIEQRAGSKGRKITGYAAVFGSETVIGDAFREVIEPGAFRQAIAEDDIRALINHNPERVIGRLKSGTLTLEEDAKGLRFEIDPPDTADARDLMHLIERGDVTGASFGFRARSGGDRWDYRAKPPLRTLTDVSVIDVSVVSFPAYPDADVALRSLAQGQRAALKEKMQASIAERAGKR